MPGTRLAVGLGVGRDFLLMSVGVGQGPPKAWGIDERIGMG